MFIYFNEFITITILTRLGVFNTQWVREHLIVGSFKNSGQYKMNQLQLPQNQKPQVQLFLPRLFSPCENRAYFSLITRKFDSKIRVRYI